MQTYTYNENVQAAQPLLSAARPHAAIPEGYSKTALINLVAKVAKPLGLTSTDLRVLQRIAEKTRAADYHSEHVSPICHERQIDMAGEIGLSAPQWRRIECKLERLGLISRDTGANGYRGGCAGPDGTRIRAGLSLEPLIERLDALEELKKQSEGIKAREQGLRLEISMQRRRLSRVALAFPDNAITRQILASKATWLRPRDYADLEALSAHNKEMDALVERSLHLQVEDTLWYTNMSGGARVSERCHIQNTIENKYKYSNEPSNEEPYKRTACKQAVMRFGAARPNGHADCLESKDVEAVASDKANYIDNLNVEQIKDLASSEMSFYIHELNPNKANKDFNDLAKAVDMRATELGINKSAVNLARAVMGYRKANLAIVIIDQNTKHPTAPVRNPGAVLRSFIVNHEKGSLNLAGSIHGIWGRSLKDRMIS